MLLDDSGLWDFCTAASPEHSANIVKGLHSSLAVLVFQTLISSASVAPPQLWSQPAPRKRYSTTEGCNILPKLSSKGPPPPVYCFLFNVTVG